ncbi:DUF2382 domain-containing protein [Streptomyces niger]|uniref:DUF2382 domain-containing protein n=1 Tax=Streptomyces niger TaxID=66373 RepID=UPI00069B3991|nr:PRC and DUF2382 domain-containing protein [Streptomyces niger]
MITQEQIPVVLDHPVYDAEGNKIGDAKHIFFDDLTGRPDWVTVRTGLFGTKETFVPTLEATVVQDHLEVPYPKSTVKDAPHVDVDAGGHLSPSDEERLFVHYGLVDEKAEQWSAQPAEGSRPGTARPDAERSAAAAAPGPVTEEPTAEAGGPAATGPAVAGESTDDAMTRSEERLRTGTERREAGRARLRKYVVTEEVQRTVPVRHEEARIEREPITEANRDAAMAGPDISEAEHEVTLHEERPVVETETVPVERVRLTTEERTDEETVRGEVRKEEIETDLPEEHDRTGQAERTRRPEERDR